MSIFIDHCVPRKFHRLLQEWGYSSLLLQEHIPVDSPDPDVLQIVQTLDAALLTIDLDFSNILDYPLLFDLYRDDLRQVLVIVEPTRYRIRKG